MVVTIFKLCSNRLSLQSKLRPILYLMLVLLSGSSLKAQQNLAFNKKLVQCEDHWVAFKPDSLGTYHFGFIYIDPSSGLTLDYAGSFKINSKGRFTLIKKEEPHSILHRLQPNDVLVSFIPDQNLSELKMERYPDWLKLYKMEEGSVMWLYRKGFLYNGWNECDNALSYLEKAYRLEPTYKGLAIELAFSYNCLEDYEKASKVLTQTLEREPKNAYLYKELIYAEIHRNNLKQAILLYDQVVNGKIDPTYTSENAFNILGAYYRLNDHEGFSKWLEKTGLKNEKKFEQYITAMENEFQK